jgi:cytochrome c-type biogenesis protein CcmE
MVEKGRCNVQRLAGRQVRGHRLQQVRDHHLSRHPPDLFREGQGIVALGKLNADGVVVADEVLAKHDEKYMPPEVTKALKTAVNPRQHLRRRVDP